MNTPHLLHCIAAGLGVLGAICAVLGFFGTAAAQGSAATTMCKFFVFGVLALALAAALGMT